MVTRRDALQTLGGLVAVAGLPGLALAAARGTDRRLVFVFLRGGMDGLSAVPAYGDPDFAAKRGELAIGAPGTTGGALRLDGMFGLSPVLVEMHKLYEAGELAVLHAAASPYRERSHFDAQNLLENGTAKPFGREAGWLNVALAESAGAGGLALGPSVPLLLRGPAKVGSWSPSLLPAPDPDLLERLAVLYRNDPLLGEAFVAAREAEGVMAGQDGKRGLRGGPQAAVQLAKAAGTFLTKRDGPRVATIDFGGWDTHANQVGEFSPLTRNLRLLDRGVATLKSSLGPAWKETAVLIVTEFGRTVAINGSRGTDHGTAGVAFAVGGAVRGGRVIADWPGLSDAALREGRDLKPTLDLRALFKAALVAQLGLGEAALETKVFPDSRSVPPLAGLFT
ncbi:MAG: DUF1501 domain-containing protein [Burkholderiales bacterium]